MPQEPGIQRAIGDLDVQESCGEEGGWQNKKTSEAEMGEMGAEEASHCPQLPRHHGCVICELGDGIAVNYCPSQCLLTSIKFPEPLLPHHLLPKLMQGTRARLLFQKDIGN